MHGNEYGALEAGLPEDVPRRLVQPRITRDAVHALRLARLERRDEDARVLADGDLEGVDQLRRDVVPGRAAQDVAVLVVDDHEPAVAAECPREVVQHRHERLGDAAGMPRRPFRPIEDLRHRDLLRGLLVALHRLARWRDRGPRDGLAQTEGFGVAEVRVDRGDDDAGLDGDQVDTDE